MAKAKTSCRTPLKKSNIVFNYSTPQNPAVKDTAPQNCYSFLLTLGESRWRITVERKFGLMPKTSGKGEETTELPESHSLGS